MPHRPTADTRTTTSCADAAGTGTSRTSIRLTPHKTLARMVADESPGATGFSQVSIEVLKRFSPVRSKSLHLSRSCPDARRPAIPEAIHRCAHTGGSREVDGKSPITLLMRGIIQRRSDRN